MSSSSPSPLLYFLILAAFPHQITSQTYTNITTSDESLTAKDAISPWRSSPSGDFTFGFQALPKGGFLLAIWFDKLPDKTMVWSANRDKPAPEGSKVRLTTSGLILTDPDGETIWSAPTQTGFGVTYAAMLDTGNFVVSNQDNESVWETFDYPTDTILPTQTLNQGTRLVSGYSKQSYSTGKFQLSMQVDGNLVLYLQGLSADNEYGPYWSTDTVGSGYQVGFDRSGEILLTARNGTVLRSIIPKSASSGGLYLRAVLDFDGVFRKYAYPMNAKAVANWTLQSNPIPTDICNTKFDLGGGICGVNSYCVIDSENHTPKCNCPEQYTLIDPESEMSGCKPTFEPQSCYADMSEADEFAFTDIADTDWPSSGNYERLPLNESQCRESCLSDCLCYLVIVNEIPECWKKNMPLSSGRTFRDSRRSRALFKIRKDNSRWTPTPTRQDPGIVNMKRDDNTVIIIVSILLGTSGVINLLFLCLRRQGTRKDNIFPPSTAIVSEAASIQTFTYKELEEATEGFKEELGKGAFGAVYRGEIGEISIAVKVLNRLTVEGEKEFKAEVNTISRTNHKNLVQLIGFCNEGENRLLVYEFMENGSLANYLFGIPKPSWFKRIEIACGIGRGLLYLHEEGSKQIIHCDIKPQNILLDATFVAKISDFGLAKLLMTDQTGTVTAIRGTRGYLAPEWFRNKPVSVKVDVYGFGVLLLELICCRKNCELNSDEENQMILSDWVFDCYRERMLHLLVEDDEEARSDMGTVQRFIKTAIWCIQEDPSLRPSMKIIMQMLEGAVEVSAPPDTSSFISSI